MKLKIAYRPEQSAEENSSFSPSAGKPAKFMAKVARSGCAFQLLHFEPVTREVLAQTHYPTFVNGVLDGKLPNGFGNTLKALAATMPFTTGSFVAAALEAFRSGECVLSPTSGFHHADYKRGGAFCTFNGLVVAAQELRKAGAAKVAIIDLDNHFGDGTAGLLELHKLEDFAGHYTFGGSCVQKADADGWLRMLPHILARFADADVWLVQLGADPYINDPLGGVLTTKQLYERDSIVFQSAKQYGLPVAWNLAGGYAANFGEVLQIHVNSIRACLAVNGTSSGCDIPAGGERLEPGR